jgi:hypothetical protein
MVRRTVKIVIRLLGGLGAGFAIIFSLLAWQLSQGPISLGFLSEYIERAINKDHPDFSLKLGDTILTWAGWQRALDIRVLDVKVVTSAGSTIGSVPEVSFSLSGDALIRGNFAPRSIELYGPRLSIRRDRDGGIDIGFGVAVAAAGAGTDSEALARRFMDRLMAAPSLEQPMSYLSRVAIIGGAVTINDQMLKKSWKLPVADIRLDRLADRLRGEINLVLNEQGRSTELVVDGDYVFTERRINLDISFTDVAPAVFSAVVTDLAPLKAFDMPLSGTVGLSFPIDGAIERIDMAIVGANGKLILPSPHKQELAVVSAKLKANFTSQSGAEIEALEINFAEGTKIQLPKPIDFPEPLRHVSLKGEMSTDGRTIKIEKLIADIGGPILSLSADVTGIGDQKGPAQISVSGGIDKMLASDLPEYWPPRVGPDPRQWIITHIRKGVVENTTFEARLTVDDSGAHKFLSLNGEMSARGAEVDYLPPMPPVTGISATMRFDEKTFSIYAKNGRSQGLVVESGRIVFTGLDQYDQFADIDLKIKGQLPDQLSYIDHKPFRFTSALNLNLDKSAGNADTRLKLFFILENDLSVDQVKVWARSTLSDVKLSNVFLGRGIENGQLDVRVDTRGMDVKGDVRIADIPAKLRWRENFSKNAEFLSRYNLRAEISDVRHVRDLGLDMEPFSGDYIRGGVKSDITYTVFAGADRRLQVNADITDAALSAPNFGWSKPVGKPGQAKVTIDLENALVVDIPKFTLTAADLDIQGAAKYALDGTGLERIDFARIAYGRTEMKGALIPKNDGGWEAGFHGPSFDLSPLWQEITSDDQGDSEDHPLLDGLTLAIEFKHVWLDRAQELFDVSGTFARVDNVWQTVIMNSRVGKDATFDLSIRPRSDGNRDFAMHAENAGEVLKALQLYENMQGGRLRITGVYDDAAPGQPLNGDIAVDDYRIINAPALAHVVSIMSLTGILDALEGDGLAFQKLEIPFELSQGTFHLKQAKATGTSLGFTASGKVFRHADVIDLEGTVIPAYAINSALGHIPVLGDLFTGGEKGGGVFAATYTMTGPMEEPVVAVNPLSALAPGFLRNVFGIFGKADGKLLSPSDEDESPTSAQ